MLGSMGEGCAAIIPPGSALGSKTITGLSYQPGTCASTGGAPLGVAKPDPNPDRASTFCCRWPFEQIE